MRLVTALTLFVLAPSITAAQSPVDTLAIAAAIAERLDSLQVRSVVADTTCRGEERCPAGTQIRNWIEVIVGAARLPARAAALPACPWGWNPARSGAGYRLRLSLPSIGNDRATIQAVRQCVNPPEYLHDVYMLGEVYRFERPEGGWRLTAVQRQWVT